MKIIWIKNELWDKAEKINILKKNKVTIPKTYIVKKNKIKICNFSFLENNKKYILRPSFLDEDNIKSSLAWYYNSIFPILKNEIISTFKNKNYINLFNWKIENLKSIIIQEFIETNIYWVYFTRNPNNIFEKWFYEIWDKNNSVTSWKKLYNIKLSFIQKKRIRNNMKKTWKYISFPSRYRILYKRLKNNYFSI